ASNSAACLAASSAFAFFAAAAAASSGVGGGSFAKAGVAKDNITINSACFILFPPPQEPACSGFYACVPGAGPRAEGGTSGVVVGGIPADGIRPAFTSSYQQ